MQWHHKFPPGLLPVSLNASCFKDAGPTCWRFVSNIFVRQKGVWKWIACVNEPGLSLLFTRGVKISGKSKEDGQTTHLITIAEIKGGKRGGGRKRKREEEDVNIYEHWCTPPMLSFVSQHWSQCASGRVLPVWPRDWWELQMIAAPYKRAHIFMVVLIGVYFIGSTKWL